MDCKEMLGLLPEYFCGELEREDMTRVTTHLLACDACQQQATELKKVLGVLARVDLPVPSPEFCRGLAERVIAAAKSDEAIPVTMTKAEPEPKPVPMPDPVKAAVPQPKVEPVNAAPVVPTPAPKVIAPKPAPPPVVKPVKVAAPKPVPPSKPKVEREQRRPLITSWKWVTRGVLPAAAAILIFIVARNLLITDQSYESAPDSTRAVAEAAPKAPAVAETTPIPAAPAATQEPGKSPADTAGGAVLPPPPPSSTESKTSSLLHGDATTMAGIAIPPSSPAPAKEARETTTRALERDKTESTGYGTAVAGRSQGEKKAAGTTRLEEMAYGSGGSAEMPAESEVIAVEGKDKAVETPAVAARDYRKAKVAAEMSDESYDYKNRLSMVGGLEKDDARSEFLPEFRHGKVPPKVADAVYLLDMAGSPSPLVHEELLLLSSDTADATDTDEAVYSEVEQQIPLLTDYELLNTLNRMDEIHLDDLKESMVNETGGSR